MNIGRILGIVATTFVVLGVAATAFSIHSFFGARHSPLSRI